MTINLRPYQQQLVDAARTEIRGGARRVLCVLSTGGGKTPCEGWVARSALERGRAPAILAHRRELVRQISVMVGRLEVPHRLIAPKDTIAEVIAAHEQHLGRVWIDDNAEAAVGSVQSAVARELSGLGLLLFDEAHHCTASQYRKVADASPDAPLVGFTATPTRLSGAGLDTAFDAMVEGPPLSQLIAEGSLVPMDAYAPVVPDMRGARTSAGDYQRAALSEQMEQGQVVAGAVEHWGRIAGKTQAFAFGCSVAHAEQLAHEARQCGIEAASVDGSMKAQQRREIIAAFEAREIQLLASCDLIGEGLDIAGGESVLGCRPTKSLALYMQQNGRAMRPAPGKQTAILVDCAGNTARHGHPCEDRAWSLTDGDKADRKRRQEDERAYAIKYCPSCFGVHPPAPRCPYCAHEYETTDRVPEAFEAELAKIQPPKPKPPKLTDDQKRERDEERKAACRSDDWQQQLIAWRAKWDAIEGKTHDPAAARKHAYVLKREYDRKRREGKFLRQPARATTISTGRHA